MNYEPFVTRFAENDCGPGGFLIYDVMCCRNKYGLTLINIKDLKPDKDGYVAIDAEGASLLLANTDLRHEWTRTPRENKW